MFRNAKRHFIRPAVVLTQLEIPVAAAEAALRCGRERGAITILNPAPVRPLPPSILQWVDILTPNQSEARVLAGLGPDADVEPEKVARDLIRKGVKQVVMTLGESGALIVTAEFVHPHSSAPHGCGGHDRRRGRLQRRTGNGAGRRREP